MREILPEQELQRANLVPFSAAFRAASREDRNLSWTQLSTRLVETGSDFAILPGRSAPRSQQGVYGGSPPLIDLQRWFKSLRSGIGITNPFREYPDRLSVGTLGFFLSSSATGKRYLVSNNHVIGRTNAAQVGEPVVQPGTLDLTTVELSLMPNEPALTRHLEIARIAAVVPIQMHQPAGIPFNVVDAAAAELVAARTSEQLAQVALGGGITGVAKPYQIDPGSGQLNQSSRVHKSGRTTGQTEGHVTHIDFVGRDVRYGSQVARFIRQIVVAASADNVGPFSDSGDSGSAVLNDRHELVGLLFGGSRLHTLVNPIQDVLDEIRKALNDPSLQVITV